MSTRIEWGEWPHDVAAFSPGQRRDFAHRVLALLLYPPTGKAKDHNSRQRQRMLMLEIISELVEIERKQAGATVQLDDYGLELVGRFMSLGGFGLMRDAYPARRYNKTKLQDQWVKLCRAFACFDIIHRAADTSTDGVIKSKTGMNQARWAVLLSIPEIKFLTGTTAQNLGQATREFQFVPHLLVALMRVIPPTMKPPTLDELRSSLSERLEAFLAHAVSLQDFFERLHVIRDRKPQSKRKMVRLPDLLISAPPPASSLSESERKFLGVYNCDDLKRLGPRDISRVRRNILEGKEFDWSSDEMTSRKT